MNLPPKWWHAIDAETIREAREALEYGLMEAGAVGTETTESVNGHLKVTGYFDGALEIEVVRAGVIDALRTYEFGPASLIEFKVREIPDQDWLAEWKKDWRPLEVGRFVITPPWIESEPGKSPGEKIIIRINPGMAFGTGTHETTRLCLKAIEKHFSGGSFLDVGTGTGILAIAAAKMFPDSRVEACDTDADAIAIARDNARQNDVQDRIEFRAGSIDEQTSSADLVCANLTAPVIVELLPALLGVTCGRMILSGILDSQVETIAARLLELGASDFEIDQDGEWVALVV